ncbi:MAG: 16S rRNA (guanine(966)-N(2))-methyltransferase RsmD [Limimaricola sp.]|uniref:16S rRNA (guanine(966)-N(2))-methyltransferase RsmD n=1 Tax=Limimaricola sp. TaxID=2211665 RepID=UPI001D583E7F|nr:16S rRNA (guanine(966)-N(2))-methyltransferase RsmD [Limimaricola sp.]MBI1418732.1 16S rRNA (guanine(966)-N(2))-methyltransferase RsmD [Limimaricola sp.]
MRIIAGRHRGLKLADVGEGDTDAHLRPTADRVRESLFNMLAGGRFGDPVTGARVLDLFAGTGALGLEALSRGATHVTFVDDGKVAGRLIRDNLRRAGRTDHATLLAVDATRLPPAPAPASLVFLDPPYAKGLGAPALAAAGAGGWLAPGALVVWEENAPQIPPPGFTLADRRRYGDTWVTVLQG